MAKRRLVSLLPAYSQTADLQNFFGGTVDQVFQPGAPDQIAGYIGRRPVTADPQDVYISEPTASRTAYQLESGMVSVDADDNISDVLVYPDFIAYMQSSGANVSDEQRLTETEFYCWAPPLNIDALVNYPQYYWFGDATGAAELPTLVLTIPLNWAVGNGQNVFFDLPASIAAVASDAEVPAVYVNNIPVEFVVIPGNQVALTSPPPMGSVVLVARVPDFATAITNQINVNISDINDYHVKRLSSGMRIKIIDALYYVGSWDAQPWDYRPWDAAGKGVYMVDGVGLSMRLTEDESLIRNIKPQYVTIDRSSLDHNLWSLHNLWVHKDTFAWANVEFPTRQAVRPIIEFVRDIVLWHVDIQLTNNAATGTTMLAGPPVAGLLGSEAVGPSFAANTVVTSVTGTVITLSKPIIAPIDHATTIRFQQVWQESIDPVFMLYDLNNVPLNDLIRYPGSTFKGSTIFSYTVGSTPIDPVLLRSVTVDQNGYYIFDNKPVIERYSYDNGTIDGLYTYAIDAGTLIVEALWHPVRWTTTQGQTNGFYDVPMNLEANPLWDDVTTISRSTWTPHFSSMIANQLEFIGQALGDNNYRDTSRDLTVGTAILQHRAPLLKAMLLAANTGFDQPQTIGFDLPQSIRYAEQEYNRFRNKFARKLVDLYNTGVLPADLVSDVILVLNDIKRDKTNQFPFALNTIAGGQYFIPPTPTCLGVLPAAVPAMVIDRTYTIPIMMCLGHDGSRTPAFSFFLTLSQNVVAGSVVLPFASINGASIGQTISGDWIAPGTTIVNLTATTLAIDTPITGTLSSGANILINDWRDPIMLELEQMIYDHLPVQFQTEARPSFDIQQWMDGAFFTPYNGYTRSEINDMLLPLFENWVLQNGLDYRSHTNFDPYNPFTWNFRDIPDQSGTPMPGNWRAIYRWYYGTDAPHLRPWEMLGFISEPSWWQGVYGAAPYTRTNTALWADLQIGLIRQGPRAGIEDAYARTGLSAVLPVDDTGALLDPVAASIVTATVTPDLASRDWMMGDQGPVENMWLNTPSYRFALATLSFLMKPARLVEQCWNLLTIGYLNNQWVDLTTSARPLHVEQYVHGEIRDGIAVQVIGVSQWIADFLLSTGHPSSLLGTAIRGLDVRLIHRMAGFISSDAMLLVADNFGLLPAENIATVLYTSPVIMTDVYSGVILEWTGHSWRAIGYDAHDPAFTIIPPDPSGPKGVISIATIAEPVILPWHPNSYYSTGVFTEFYHTVWQCIRSHTSSPQFEQNFWQSRPDMSPNMVRAPRVTTYARGINVVQRIPYGTEFTTLQQIADFVLGWERWLISRGWSFTDTVPATGELRNWSLSVKEFLSWTQVQWAPGNFIALSPGQQHLEYTAATGTILNVENDTTGFFGLIDRSGRPITQRDATVNRLDGDINIHAKNADVFAARLSLVNIEHALVFSNITIFDDVIYLPLFDIRQLRLRLNCQRAPNWTGRLDAPGFVITGNTINADFETAADDVRLMFDIEPPVQANLRNYARHVIGFQRRDYLVNLFLSDIEQFEFYQGMISQKGAPGVFNKLVRSNRASDNSNLQFLEEWAVRIDEFGAPIDPFLIFQLRQTEMRNDPQIVRLIPTDAAPLDWIVLASVDDRWLDQPATPATFFSMRDTGPTLPSAGPVRLAEVTNTAFALSNLPDMYMTMLSAGTVPFSTGSTTWVYERNDGTYTVLESFETGRGPNSILKVITNAEDATIDPTTARLVFQQPITLTMVDIGNYLVVDGLSLAVPELQGLVTITAIDVADKTVDVQVAGTAGHDFTDDTTSAPLVRVLREVRFDTYEHLVNAPYLFAVGDLAWIDAGATNDTLGSYALGTLPLGLIASWRVLQWTGTAWITLRQQPPRTDPTTISETAVYYAGMQMVTTTTNPQMIIDEPVVDDVIVIDPLAGFIAGIADRDIDFKVAYDPARYNAGVEYAENPWGMNEVGRVWWNLATVKFLDPFTDMMGETSDRDIAELQYRIANWSRLAPGTSVDIYEWTVSRTDPTTYTGPGTVFNSDSPSWVVQTVYDPLVGYDIVKYFFWVTGLTQTPSMAFRHENISTIALAIANPSALDLAWMAPIHQDALIVSGVSQFLNDTTSVMKIRLTMQIDNPGRHDEWCLMRPTDKTSLPSTTLWQKLRDSLAGFDYLAQPIPAPSLNVMRATGIRPLQNMFLVADGGLLAARQSFVGMINNIFVSVPIRSTRIAQVNSIYRSTLRASDTEVIDPYLIWMQPDDSYIIEPPPYNEWDVQVFSVDERNRLLTRPDFIDAASNGTNLRVLVNNMAGATPQWSIWQFNGVIGQQLITASFPGTIDQVLFQHAASIFTLATAYDVIVADRTARDMLVGTLAEGTRVFVTRDVANFWAIWNYLPSDEAADAAGFVLWRAQSYRTDDFIIMADWYATGYQAINPPIVTYSSLTERNIAEAPTPLNHFVKVNDDGTSEHHWIWTQYVIDPDNPSLPGEWQTVAIQNGTLQLSDAFSSNSTVPYNVNVATLVSAAASAGDYLITVSDAHGISAGQFIIAPGIAHNTKVTGVNGTLVSLDRSLDTALAVGTTVTVTRIDLGNVVNRDGSWEIFVLADALRYGGLLLDSEINELFFSMLNFVHVQQHSVDWAFKTSFMTIIGYDVPLHQTPVLLADQTTNLIAYINEVKPYHCKIRDFSTQYNTDLDVGTINGPDVEAEASYFTVGLLFDRYAPGDAWDVNPWQLYPWDDGDSNPNQVAVHTSVLALAGNTAQVEDVSALKDYLPFDITINNNVYHVIAVSIDATNANVNTDVTAIPPLPMSGKLTADRLITEHVGDEIEAILAIPNAVQRTFLNYPPIGDLTSEQAASLFGSDTRSVANTYVVAIDALTGDTSIRLTSTTSIVVGQPVFGPIVVGQPIVASNIAQGTMVLSVSANLITLNRPLVRKLAAGASIGVGLPVKLSGGSLQAPSSQFAMILNADVAQGSLVLGFARTVGAAIGQVVEGTGIAAGTLITQVSATTITLNTATTAPLINGMTVTVNALPDIIYDGSALHLTAPLDVTINPPLTSRPGGFDLRAPYHEAQHPEERIPFDFDDALHMTVVAQPVAGAPPQIVKAFNVSGLTGNNVTLFYDMIAQSAAAVMVFRDGVRAMLNTDYTVDHFARTATVNLFPGLRRIMIHVFGYGGLSAVIDTYFPSFQGNPVTIAPPVIMPPNWHIDPNAVAVTVNGVSANFTIQDNLLTLTPPPSVGADVAIVVYGGWVSTSASQMSVQTFVVTGATTWQLTPHDTDTKPTIAGTIVEANGLRLTPTTDYTVNNRGVLTVTKALNFQDTVVATLFTHATGMGIQTSTFTVGIQDTSTHAFDFRTGTLDPQINFTRASPATYFDPTGTMQSASNNVPRFDYDPTSGTNLGLLLEEARTNSIRNPRAEGAVVGLPGTLPTNWSIGGGLAGLTLSVIGMGTDSGIPYIDIRFNGTTTGAGGTTINFEPGNRIAALTGQTWSLSVFLRLISGSFANITSSILVMQEYTSGGSVTAAETQIVTPTTTNLNGQRFSFNTTLSGGATTAFVQPYFKINYGTGAVIDVTVRIGAPQAEAGVCQTSTILPVVGAPAATTRAVDVASVSLSTVGWYHSGGDFSIAIDYDSHRPVMTNAGAALGMSISNAFADSLYVEVPYTVFGAPGPGLISNGVYNVGANITAFSVSSSQIILSNNGTAATVNNTGAVYAFNTMYIGGNWAGGGTLNGHVTRVRIWNNALNAADVTQNSTAFASQPFIVPCPIAKYYSFVSMNGLTLLEDVDYTIIPSTTTIAVLTIPALTAGTIVATVFTTPIARDLQQWMVNSRLPAAVRMPLLPPIEEFGTPLGEVFLGTTVLVSAQLGRATNKPLGQIVLGTDPIGAAFVYPQFDVLDEYCEQSAYMAGTLMVDFANDSHAIVLDAFQRDLSPKLLPDQPFTIPTITTPGSVWIDSERIEYFGYGRTNDVITLTQLRRATRGTSMLPHSIGAVVSNGDLIIEPPEQAAARLPGYSTYMTLGGLVATTGVGRLTPMLSGQTLLGLAATGLVNNPQEWSIAGAPAKGIAGSVGLAGATKSKQVTGVHANGMSGKPTSHVT